MFIFPLILNDVSKSLLTIFPQIKCSKNKKSKLIKNKKIYQKIRHFIGIMISHIVCWRLKVDIVDTQSGMKGFENIRILQDHKFISQKFFLDIGPFINPETSFLFIKLIPTLKHLPI